MFYCIAVFGSRTHAIGFIKYMRDRGITCIAVPTPQTIGAGCGISAKFSISQTAFAKQVISALALTSFRGFFSVRKEGAKQIITEL